MCHRKEAIQTNTNFLAFISLGDTAVTYSLSSTIPSMCYVNCQVLGGDLMKNFYRMLKHVQTVEKDDVVILHVQLALEEIESFMKDFLFPEQSFTKQIHVLDHLDVD